MKPVNGKVGSYNSGGDGDCDCVEVTLSPTARADFLTAVSR
ncbi:hypothetical protein [Streptomyces fulvoviolaceus]|nr:hypothetical protein [Streptomyces fulvoviolaceus]MCT9080250.1 hypothetical protein [Streptomyces fulvoviolaceus]